MQTNNCSEGFSKLWNRTNIRPLTAASRIAQKGKIDIRLVEIEKKVTKEPRPWISTNETGCIFPPVFYGPKAHSDVFFEQGRGVTFFRNP